MTVLHIDSSITGAGSASRAITAAVVAKLREADPTLDVTYRDLAAQPLPHLTLDVLADTAANADLQQFLATDTIVIGAGMYNFTIPTQLKAWFDRIVIAGQTFAYGPNGPEGLAGGKRVIVVLTRGGLYGEGSPAQALEHAETYLRGTLGFIGIDPQIIVAEGIALGEDSRNAAIAAAVDRANDIALKIAA